MMYNQHEIESLNEEDYSMFLAYGDTFPNQETSTVREGSDFLWPPEITRFSEITGGEELRFRECVRNSKYSLSFASGYTGD